LPANFFNAVSYCRIILGMSTMQTNEEGYGNFFDDDDDEAPVDAGGKSDYKCKKCGKAVIAGTKGISLLKELCEKCNGGEIADLTDFSIFDNDSSACNGSKITVEPLPAIDFSCDHPGCVQDYVGPCNECHGDYCESHTESHCCRDYITSEKAKALIEKLLVSSSSNSNISSSGSSGAPSTAGVSTTASSTAPSAITTTTSTAGTTSTNDSTNGEDAKKEDPDFNSRAFLEPFFTDEVSNPLPVGGIEQLYTLKKYHHGPHRCYLDLEIRSRLPNMLNYYLLSAVAMKKEGKVFYALCWIRSNKTSKLYILLAVLRSKCLQIRYEFLLCDQEDNNNVFQLCGVKSMMNYTFLPDIPINHDECVQILSRHICDPENMLALIPGVANKDEYGHVMVGGFDPFALALDGGKKPKRDRTKRNLEDEEIITTSLTKSNRGKKKNSSKKDATQTKSSKKKRGNAKSVSSANVNVL
jgi:hypothetical protein